MMRLRQALQWLPDGTLVGDASVQFTRVHTDSRSLQAGDLFVALAGERFDGNDFLAQAKASGAVAALAHSADALRQAGLPGIAVADSKRALGTLATQWRRQFTLPLIAVTGSNGKTTVTQMLASILRAYRSDATLATEGNLNNDIGLPLTLLRLRAHHRMAAVELGMNHPGEIALLAAMAQPGVALVNNAQREHLEFMTTVEAVAQENGAVIAALPADGVAVFPHHDAFDATWRALAGARRQMTFAVAPTQQPCAADVHCPAPLWRQGAWQIRATVPGAELAFSLAVAGLHNVHNALAAVTCALAAGVAGDAIVRGLNAFEPVKGRSRALSLNIGVHSYTLIDDSYNANPDSVQAAIQMLASLPGPRLLVLGDMAEVGDQGALFHRQAGDAARQQGIDALYTLGELSAGASGEFAGARHFDSMAALIASVRAALPQFSSVLVKGSRCMQMERVVNAVVASAQTAPQAAQDAPCC